MPEIEIEPASTNGGPHVLTSKKSSEDEPMREKEGETAEWVDQLLDEAEKARDEQCDTTAWERDLESYWGDSWPASVPSYKPRIRVNEIKSLLLQELSDLTDSRLTIYAMKDGRSGERDDQVEKSIQTYWKNNSCDMVILQAALDAMVAPLGFIQTAWDSRMRQGEGEILFKCRNPQTVYPDPSAEWDPQSGEEVNLYYVLTDVMDIVAIRQMYPETGKNVTPEAEWSTRSEKMTEKPGPRSGSGYMGPLYTKGKLGQGIPGWKTARARMKTCIVDDPDKVDELEEIQGRLRRVERYAYPHRRQIITANGRVLYDDDQPYWYAPQYSSVRMQPSIHAYWPAQSLVSEFAEIQTTANKADSMVAENMLRCNASVIFADADSGINPKTYAPIPGLVMLRKPGSRVDVVQATPMPGEMVTQGERLRGYMRGVMGYPLSRTGAGTHGNVAAELAETEISQAMGLTRLRGRLLYQSVQQAVRMIFARMAQFYTTPRYLPYIEQGEIKGIQWQPVAKPEQYLIHLDEDSFAVRSQTMTQRLALGLAKMQKIDDETLLTILNFPNAKAVAGKVQKQLALMAAARMAQKKGKK